MNIIVSINEAIEILLEYKSKGGDTVIISERDNKNGLLMCGLKKSVIGGIEVIKKSQSPIEYNENHFINSLMTENDMRRKIILFGKST